MASAEKTYVDPSALRRLYVHDSLSRAFCSWRARLGGSLPLTLHGKAELTNSISLAVFRKDVTGDAGFAALADLDADVNEGRLFIVDVPWRRALESSTELSRTFTPKFGTRTLDVLHVATALTIGCRQFVTYDSRQAKLARAAGLKLASP